MSLATKLFRAVRNPGSAVSLLIALGKGHFYKTWLPLRGIRFTAGRNFRVFGSLTVRGPGRVIFGDDIVVNMHVTPFTHAPDAIIRVGNHCFLNGARFGCVELIDIGDDCILADCRVMDSNFHSTRADRWSAEAPIRTRPVLIAKNVWLGAQVGVLPGTRIGENSVVGFGAVCSGAHPANMLIAGNPAVAIRPIDGAPTVSDEPALDRPEIAGPVA